MSSLGIAVRLSVVLAIVLGLSAASAVATAPDVVALTMSGTMAKDEKDDDKKIQKIKNDNDADHDFRGQVLEIHKDTTPPELLAAGQDGKATIKLLKANLISESGVGVGDHVRATGEKVHELLFDATTLEVRVRCCGEPHSDNDAVSDNASDTEEDNENR